MSFKFLYNMYTFIYMYLTIGRGRLISLLRKYVKCEKYNETLGFFNINKNIYNKPF